MTQLRETRVRDNVRTWTLGGESIATSYGANASVVIGRDAALVIDSFIAPAYARLLERAIRSVSPAPVRFVVLTHHHTDHALGASHFAAAEVEVIAHRSCAERMAAEHHALIASRRRQPEIEELFRDAEPYSPTRVFDDEIVLDLGETRARIFHPGHNHTPGDAAVHLQEESVVICGDLVSDGYHVNYEDAAVENLAGGLDSLRSLEARTIVPGHGDPGGSDLLDSQGRYHSAVRDAVLAGGNAAERIRVAFPSHLLGEVLPSSIEKPWHLYETVRPSGRAGLPSTR